jgi:hypothetical protein
MVNRMEHQYERGLDAKYASFSEKDKAAIAFIHLNKQDPSVYFDYIEWERAFLKLGPEKTNLYELYQQGQLDKDIREYEAKKKELLHLGSKSKSELIVSVVDSIKNTDALKYLEAFKNNLASEAKIEAIFSNMVTSGQFGKTICDDISMERKLNSEIFLSREGLYSLHPDAVRIINNSANHQQAIENLQGESERIQDLIITRAAEGQNQEASRWAIQNEEILVAKKYMEEIVRSEVIIKSIEMDDTHVFSQEIIRSQFDTQVFRPEKKAEPLLDPGKELNINKEQNIELVPEI